MTAGQNNQDGFSPVSSDSEPLIPFDVREQTGRRSVLILAGVILALLAFALVLFFTYQPGTRDRDIAPRISADKAPFKVEPENPGGAQTPDQDKAVYDVMAGKDVNETVTPAPSSERPMELPSAANVQLDAPKAVSPAPQVATPQITTPKVTAPAPQPVVTAPTPAASGDYVVQVASVRDRGDAQALWNTVSSKFGDVMTPGLYSDIKRVDLNDKGIYYRLRVAGLPDKAAAKRLCDRLKARGQACLVARK